jgi:hypothetical protein
MPPALSIDQHAAKVFISYSRKDSAFAEQLVSALTERRFAAYLDTKDIAPGEPWQQRLGKLVLAADAVVFLLSPDAVKSPICRWEIDEALRRQKRVLPVVHRPTELASIPPELAELNFIDMSLPENVDHRLTVLAGAINTDIEWVWEHTRIGERAEEWNAAGRRRSEMLRGEALESAERWLARQTKTANWPTDLHREFIAAGRRESTRRLRFWLAGAIAALAIASGLGTLAEVNRREAAAQRDAALLNQSRRLTTVAQGFYRTGDYATAMALGLEALPDKRRGVQRPHVPAAESILYQAVSGTSCMRIRRGCSPPSTPQTDAG